MTDKINEWTPGDPCCGGCVLADISFANDGNWASFATVESGTSTQLSDALRLAPGARLRINAVDAGKVPIMVIATIRAQTAVAVLPYRWEIEDSAGDGTPEETVIVTNDPPDRKITMSSTGRYYKRGSELASTDVRQVDLAVAQNNYYAGDWSVGPLESTIDNGTAILTSERDNPQSSVSLLLQNDAATGLEIEALWITSADTPDALHSDCQHYGGPTPVELECPAYPYACSVTPDSDHLRWSSADVQMPGLSSDYTVDTSHDYCSVQFSKRAPEENILAVWSTEHGNEPTFSEPQYPLVSFTAEVSEHPSDCTKMVVTLSGTFELLTAWNIIGSSGECNSTHRAHSLFRGTWERTIGKPAPFGSYPSVTFGAGDLLTYEMWNGSSWETVTAYGVFPGWYSFCIASVSFGSGTTTGLPRTFWSPGTSPWGGGGDGAKIDGTIIEAGRDWFDDIEVTLNP